jgi:hypothetical protein
LGGRGFWGGYFSVFPGSHYVDHPTIRSLWLGPSREGGGGSSSQSWITASSTWTPFLYISKIIMGLTLHWSYQNSKTADFCPRLLAHEIMEHGGRYTIVQGQLQHMSVK